MSIVDTRRVLLLNSKSLAVGPVVYWMYRDHRLHDNWALLRAQEIALQMQQPLLIIVAFRSDLRLHAGAARWFNPMTEGLQEVAVSAKAKGISFTVLVGDPGKTVPAFLRKIGAGAVVCDFSPLVVPRSWQQSLAKKSNFSWECVDAHNVIPCWFASDKQEFAARTFRPKVHKLRDTFFVPFPKLVNHPFQLDAIFQNSYEPDLVAKRMQRNIAVSQAVGEVDWFQPGEKAAHIAAENFVQSRLQAYSIARNDPTKDGLSNMSAYLHFGHIAPARLIQKVEAAQNTSNTESVEAFFEEAVVRRELSDNFCFYSADYTSVAGLADWAQKTLQDHSQDQREYTYTYEEFAAAKTHDDAWNAAQQQLVQTGKMHGYMRMYWAKKILEWSISPNEAIQYAIKMNDLYELDGRDPNGYVGILWSIGGLHDRAWFERAIFGKVRYMNANGLARKFDLASYVSRWTKDLKV